MKKIFFIFIILCFSVHAFSQLASQNDFTEKFSLSEQQVAYKLLKGVKTYNGDNYDVKYHRMNWTIDPDTLFISGEVTTYFKITKAAVSQITFDFSSVLAVDSIIYHSSNASYSQTIDSALIINLPSPLPLNQLDSVSIYYHGVPHGSGFGSFVKSSHKGTNIIWTLSEPYGAKDWWPCKNNLSDKIDSIDVYITTPQQYRASSNGLLISVTQQDSNKVYHWKHRYPIAAYLIAAAVTNYQTFSFYAHIANDSIEILNQVYPENMPQAQTESSGIVWMIEFYDSLFIPYPFIKERYGQTQFGKTGGMEHQTNTFLSGFAFEIMSHELLHQWTGDMITCGNWHEIWLNEGFATYGTGLCFEHASVNYYWPMWKKGQIMKITSQPGGSVYCKDTTNISRIFDDRLTYSKGAMLLDMLRWVIGDNAFFAGIRGYLSDTSIAYKYACSDNLITHMETACGKDLTEFFNNWLYGQGYPIYTIHCTSVPQSNNVQVIIDQSQSDPSVSFFKLPIPLEFKDAMHDTIIVFQDTLPGQQYVVNAGFKSDSIKFDPKMHIVTANDTIIMNINEYSAPSHIIVYPDPVKDILYMRFSGEQFQHAEIYDIRGRMAYSVNRPIVQGELEINLKEFANGIYFLKATFDKNAFVSKITKM